MRKLVMTMWTSLDGLIAGPAGEMDWVNGIFSPEMGKYEDDLVSRAGGLMLGRVTYQSFAGAWPSVPDNPAVPEDEKAYARKLNAMPKYVFSRTLVKAEWNNSTLLREIDPSQIQQLKQAPGGDILIYGSASIVQALTNLGLVDEYQVLVHPLLLGQGKPLFADLRSRTSLKLVSSQVHPNGVALLVYQPATVTQD
jgi:dihydrofolate reductase